PSPTRRSTPHWPRLAGWSPRSRPPPGDPRRSCLTVPVRQPVRDKGPARPHGRDDDSEATMTLVHPPLVAAMVDGIETEGPTVASTNPARLDETVAEVRLGGPGVLVAAARVGRAAQRHWAGVPAPVRGTVIGNFGRLVEDNADALARLVTREIGKPLAEARGEVQEIIDTCRFFLGE